MGLLGCGTHTVRIIDRATGTTVATPPLAKVQWGRRRDEWSTAVVTFTKRPGTDCCGGLGDVRSWRHELEIARNGVVVWVGPVNRVAENRSRVQVNAVDRLGWLGRRELRGTRTLTDMEPTRILGVVLGEALGRYDRIPIRPAFTVTATTASLSWAHTARTLAWASLRDLIATHLDLTMVADVLYAGATTVPAGIVATLTQDHIIADADVIEDGDATATVVHVRGANGLTATWPPEPSDTPTGDDWWGVIDGVYDRSTLTTAADLTAAARAAWRARRRPPVFVELPGGARLSPSAPIEVAQLIPGAEVTLSITEGRCRPITGRYVVDEVDVSEGAGGGAARTTGGQFTTAGEAAAESVSVSLVPAGAVDG